MKSPWNHHFIMVKTMKSPWNISPSPVSVCRRRRRGEALQRQRHRQQLLGRCLRAVGAAGGEVPAAAAGGGESAGQDVPRAAFLGRENDEHLGDLMGNDGNFTRKNGENRKFHQPKWRFWCDLWWFMLSWCKELGEVWLLFTTLWTSTILWTSLNHQAMGFEQQEQQGSFAKQMQGMGPLLYPVFSGIFTVGFSMRNAS